MHAPHTAHCYLHSLVFHEVRQEHLSDYIFQNELNQFLQNHFLLLNTEGLLASEYLFLKYINFKRESIIMQLVVDD